LQNLEDTIQRKEGEYLEDTPAGNIIIGFEGYVKGGGLGGGGGGRRAGDRGAGGRGGIDALRVFSRSSVSFKPVQDNSVVSA
jgi:chromatin modification-related protein EAF6